MHFPARTDRGCQPPGVPHPGVDRYRSRESRIRDGWNRDGTAARDRETAGLNTEFEQTERKIFFSLSQRARDAEKRRVISPLRNPAARAQFKLRVRVAHRGLAGPRLCRMYTREVCQ